ncbi:MAG TPA: GrpB family protein [Streptosporangiaceae bacterium]
MPCGRWAPGLAAKPVIDLDIVVREADVVAASGVLVSLGFAPLGELGIPLRWAFKEPARLAGTNTYSPPSPATRCPRTTSCHGNAAR